MRKTARRVVNATQGTCRLALLALHIVHGALQVRLLFGTLDAAGRHARIGAWSRRTLRLLRVDLQALQLPAAGPRLIVANHVSWLDIVVIHALLPHTRFVAKQDIARWPLVGWLVAGGGTLLVDRDRPRDAARAVDCIGAALDAGHTLALFPEGTTSDGSQLLGLHSSLLQGAVQAQSPVQPLVLHYAEGGRMPSPSVPYEGSTTFIQSLWRVCTARALVAHVQALPEQPAPHADRHVLTRRLQAEMAAALARSAPGA